MQGTLQNGVGCLALFCVLIHRKIETPTEKSTFSSFYLRSIGGYNPLHLDDRQTYLE